MTISKSHSPYPSTVKQPLWQSENRTIAPYYKDILIGLLLFATPFLLFPQRYGLLVLLVLPGLWCLRWALVGRIIPRTPLDWPVLLILLMILVSIGATFDLSFSIGKIAGLLLGIVIYYAIVDLTQTRTALHRVIAVFLFAGVGLAVISVLGTRWANKFPLIQPWVDQLPRAFQGVQGAESGFNPNQVGGVLIIFVPLQVALCGYWLKRALSSNSSRWASSDRIKGIQNVILIGLSLLITAGTLLVSQSRGAIGGLAVGLLAIAAIHTRWGKILAILGLIAILVVLYSGRVNELVTSGLETEAAGTIRLDGRLEIWSRALQGLADFPLGMGMNNFRRVMPILYPAFIIPPTTDIAHAHNHLLQAGLDLGISGLIAYLALWLGGGFLLFQVALNSRYRFYRAVALGLIGGFTAYFIYGITDTVALGAKPGFVFWWALGLGVAVYNLFEQDKFSS